MRESPSSPAPEPAVNRVFRGIAASPGITIGPAHLLDAAEVVVTKRRVRETELDAEIERFEQAVLETRQEIIRIKQKVAKEIGDAEAEIFNAYLHILEDPLLITATKERIPKDRWNAEYVLQQIGQELAKQFTASGDEYLQERTSDLNDVVGRLLRHLTGQAPTGHGESEQAAVIFARNLSPSRTASMRRERVLGFVTEVGGRTSHAAIMARSLEIPAVVGVEAVMTLVNNGDTVIVDGTSGEIILTPDSKTLTKYTQAQLRFQQSARKLKKLKGVTAVTKDGYRVTVAANIEVPEDVRAARRHGAEGIGLFRTEYLYLNRTELPDEEEQYEAYKVVAQQSLPYATIIRTLDLGGDKFFTLLGTSREMNPFLGLRAIRLCLAHIDLFKVQLRAILRASHFGKVKIMFPMISDVVELRRAKAILAEVQQELKARHVAFDRNLEVGCMIELPSAAVMSDVLAREVQFFSLGTNDLIQYTMAADRGNEKVAYLYDPLHPAILRLIKTTLDAAHQARIWVGMCGEMAADPLLTPLLVGMGLDEFSMGPAFVPELKQCIRSIVYADCKMLAEKVMRCATTQEVQTLLNLEGGASCQTPDLV